MSPPLRDAIRAQDLAAVEAALAQTPSTEELTSGLLVAAYRGDLPITERLFAVHPEPESVRESAVAFAVRNNQLPIVQALATPAMRDGILTAALAHDHDQLFLQVYFAEPRESEAAVRWLEAALDQHRIMVVRGVMKEDLAQAEPGAWEDRIWHMALAASESDLLTWLMEVRGRPWSDPGHQGLLRALQNDNEVIVALATAHAEPSDLARLVQAWEKELIDAPERQNWDWEETFFPEAPELLARLKQHLPAPPIPRVSEATPALPLPRSRPRPHR